LVRHERSDTLPAERSRAVDASAAEDVSSTLTFRGAAYPVVLPSVRDPRLHVAAVIMTIHVLGQTELQFRVTVPQILAAILTCALIEVVITFRERRAFVWPASAMLTGSGVALILRVPDTPVGSHWSTHAWWVFAAVAALSLATKYIVRVRGSQLFNPSNVGLVIVFLAFGSARLEPLDFWWAPLTAGMVTAYAVILTGGLLVTARLGLLAAAASFWITLAAGLGVLAASGHCMVARWAFAPVCGFDYWRVILTSPEVLIFMFFMITDPKTVPAGRVGRVMFGFMVAAVSTILMATQTTEFGTKVALLAGLTVVCAGRPLLERVLPEALTPADGLLPFIRGHGAASGVKTITLRAGAFLAVVAVLAAAVLGAATARGSVPPAAGVVGRLPREVDPATFPSISIDQDVLDWNHEINGPGAREVVLTLAENLELESQALRRRDPSILVAVDHGDRLIEMRERLQHDTSSAVVTVDRYQIDDVHVTLLVPFGRQDGLSLGLRSRGTMVTETYDTAGNLRAQVSAPFAKTFVVRRATGARWLNVAVLAPGER
jgi:Na+-translocating ferredoxin:NAD+ oxidoreductase RnfD subunit